MVTSGLFLFQHKYPVDFFISGSVICGIFSRLLLVASSTLFPLMQDILLLHVVRNRVKEFCLTGPSAGGGSSLGG